MINHLQRRPGRSQTLPGTFFQVYKSIQSKAKWSQKLVKEHVAAKCMEGKKFESNEAWNYSEPVSVLASHFLMSSLLHLRLWCKICKRGTIRVNKTNAESKFSFHLCLNFSFITTSIQSKIFCLLDFFLILMRLHAIMCFFPTAFNNSKADSDRVVITFDSTVNFLSSCERGYKAFINAYRQPVPIRASLVFEINGKRWGALSSPLCQHTDRCCQLFLWACSGLFAVNADAFQNEPAQSAVIENCQQTLENWFIIFGSPLVCLSVSLCLCLIKSSVFVAAAIIFRITLRIHMLSLVSRRARRHARKENKLEILINATTGHTSCVAA